MLATMYYYGQGTIINYEAALENFTKAANQSANEWAAAQGELMLGNIHRLGRVAESNYASALIYFHRAAKSCNKTIQAQARLKLVRDALFR